MESRKRKNSSNDNIVSKRKRKSDSEFTNFIELIKLRKCIIKLEKEKNTIVNKNKELILNQNFLENKVNKLEKRIMRIEKFNQELRDKNLRLDEELQNKKEQEICENLSNISILPTYSYIN